MGFKMEIGDNIEKWEKDFEKEWHPCEKQKDPLKCAIKTLSSSILRLNVSDEDNRKIIDTCTDIVSKLLKPYMTINKKKGRLDVKGLFIAGLAIVGISMIFIYQKKYNNDQKEVSLERKEKNTNVHTTSCSPEQNVLILVLRAGNESCLNTLKENKRLNLELCDDLYKATRYLWVGNEAQFNSSQIIKWFDGTNIAEQSSSLDVHLIKLILNKNYSGLLKSADGQSRYNAFKQMCQDGVQIEGFSPRVSNAAYGTTEVYEK